MPERQSSTDEQTERPTTEPVGPSGASAGTGRDDPSGGPTAAAGDGTGAGANGAGTDGAVADGPAPSAPAANGPAANGAATNGAATNGSVTSGAATDGSTANGSASTPAAGPGTAGDAAAATGAPDADGAAATGAAGTGNDTGGTTAVAPTDGTGTGGTGTGGTGTGGTGATGSPPRPATGDGTTPDQEAAPDGAGERASLFEPTTGPATDAEAQPPAAATPPAEPAGDDAVSTVVIPGRKPGAGRPAAAGARPTADARPGQADRTPSADRGETVRVPLSAGSATGAPTRPTHSPGGDAPTRGVAPSTPDAEATQVIPLNRTGSRPSTPAAPVDPPTQRLPVMPGGGPPRGPRGPGGPGGGGGATGGAGRSRRRRPLLIGAIVAALLGLLYLGDLLLTSGSVPRGTTVAGVDVGGLSLGAAEQELREAIEPRVTQPVPVTAGTVTSEIDPVAAGLTIDWDGTLAQAGDQPLNPITRIASFFTTSNVLGVVTTADDQALGTAIQQLAPVVDTEPVEGTVRFEGTTPVPVDPVPGQQLDAPAAIEVVKSEWAAGRSIALPLTTLPARTTAEDVATAVEDVATPAVSGPVTVIGENNTVGVLEPETIAEALAFEPGESGGLTPVLNPTVITDALEDQLAASEQEARDAELDFATTPPTVVPSQDGRGVDYEATLADLLPVLTDGGPRQITAVYAVQPAELTTEELGTLGNAGEISRFTTRGFAQDSGINIRRAAELVNGTIVGPGETFSLDAVTGPRTAANGYVEAGVIENGRAGRGIAGGVSQVSTTTYNAAYFAGMTDVEHRPHSFYISRYPEGREATIVTGALDMRFRNDTPTAVLIRTVWTPTDITVIFYGTKYFDVTSTTSPRRNFTEPNVVTVPAGEPCTPSQGSQGFTVTDTRTIRDLRTGEVRTEEQTTKYNPAPQVVCGA